jgi:hypothetical protein
LDWFGTVEQVGGAVCVAAEFEPRFPILGLDAVIHCCSGNRFPSSVNITIEIRSGIRGTSRQNCCWGKGKRWLKWVRNAVLQVMLKLREAMSAISLALPAIEPMVKGPAWTEH